MDGGGVYKGGCKRGQGTMSEGFLIQHTDTGMNTHTLWHGNTPPTHTHTLAWDHTTNTHTHTLWHGNTPPTHTYFHPCVLGVTHLKNVQETRVLVKTKGNGGQR